MDTLHQGLQDERVSVGDLGLSVLISLCMVEARNFCQAVAWKTLIYKDINSLFTLLLTPAIVFVRSIVAELCLNSKNVLRHVAQLLLMVLRSCASSSCKDHIVTFCLTGRAIDPLVGQ